MNIADIYMKKIVMMWGSPAYNLKKGDKGTVVGWDNYSQAPIVEFSTGLIAVHPNFFVIK